MADQKQAGLRQSCANLSTLVAWLCSNSRAQAAARGAACGSIARRLQASRASAAGVVIACGVPEEQQSAGTPQVSNTIRDAAQVFFVLKVCPVRLCLLAFSNSL
jgi:hypothetical protein